MTGLPPAHTPAWQVSLCVQALPSSHDEPFALLGFEQSPVSGSHVPALWHWSDAVQTTGFAPTHTPAWQVSLCVQASPSSHAVSSGCLTSAGHAPALPEHTSSTSH